MSYSGEVFGGAERASRGRLAGWAEEPERRDGVGNWALDAEVGEQQAYDNKAGARLSR